MLFLLISFIAGFITVLAPCVLPLLPVIIGSSISDVRSKIKPYVIALSLTVSVILFTLVLKVATIFIDIPQTFWQYLSGGVLVFFGLITIFPSIWDKGAIRLNLLIGRKSNKIMTAGVMKESLWGDVIIGASLGPVFSSCSPTYFVILATVLPQSFARGLVYLIAYSIGLSLALLIIAKLGQKVIGKLEGVSNPEGWFKRTLGIVFLLVGLFVISGQDKVLQTYVASNSFFDITKVEERFLLPAISNNDTTQTPSDMNEVLDQIQNPKVKDASLLTMVEKKLKYSQYKELTNPSGFVNTDAFKLKDLIGKKVILLDVMTYSCINCQRTFPYANAWYEKYKDRGLEIVAIHTPEFAFEKKIENVREAMEKFGIKFPVVLDNDYGTWNAYGNSYWPRKYLIDIDGFVVYDHIGEGGYDETESRIKEALNERVERLGDIGVLGQDNKNVTEKINKYVSGTQSTETYFGAHRNAQFLGNGEVLKVYTDTFRLPKTIAFNEFYLGGKWSISEEYIESQGDSVLVFNYDATKVHLVAESLVGKDIGIKNGDSGSQTSVNIKDATLYTIVDNPKETNNTFYLSVPKGVRLYALTFS